MALYLGKVKLESIFEIAGNAVSYIGRHYFQNWQKLPIKAFEAMQLISAES